MCGESAGFFIKSDYAGACGLGFEKKVFFDSARAVRSVFFDGARAVRSVFLAGAWARCGAGENARAGAEMVIKCEMGMIRF